ncbi:hypothetical protein AMJ71_06120 [candidate division TA06 bacterium SM1_40]|uniref:Terminase large subunit gp17-like C-terminal domain-containing protein n=1 Tax=candidate division TA06 bacterium SM1_40 TaxID=1703773 RepID=A0A0S8JL52_UNCT6|nr:MAG: hypothetical protein AMJ71_06120 [candidate division TA06 bacterium SM1_40]
MPKRKRVDDELKRDLSGSQLREFLSRAGLPENYPQLTPAVRRKARKAVLTSWFDLSCPHVLCTDTDQYVRAHFLWTEFYMKPAAINRGVYYFEDFQSKYDMIREVMSPSLEPENPAKTIVTASRRASKTQSLIIEGLTLIGVNRPFTLSLISEYNATRTGEEIKKVQDQIEENERIHSDFGAEGILFPKRSSGTWSSKHLKFLHLPGCEVMGHSMKSAQRGRGPLYGIVDDPEDEEVTYNRDWRRWFFSRLLDAFVEMFHHGGKVCWIGTPIHGGSCLSQAMAGKSEKEETGDESLSDKRFRDWRKVKMSLVVKDGEGQWKSMQPERLTVDAFLKKLEQNPVTVRKEILCEPVTPGTRAFPYDSAKHGFMHCEGDDGSEYCLDLYTGEEVSWRKFLDSLFITGAGDPADGQSRDADPGALVFTGINPGGIIYVLDVYTKRCLYEHLLEMAYTIAEEWKCGVFGWEKAALQCVINRMARRFVEKLQEEGKTPPVFRELENAKRNKIARILSLTPYFTRKEIRFRQLTPITGPDGRVHRPAKYPREGHYRELISQMVEYTDEGIRGHDDCADGLEMAIRLIGRSRGGGDFGPPESPTDRIVTSWRMAGLPISAAQISPEVWTPKIEREIEAIEFPENELLTCVGAVPYV